MKAFWKKDFTHYYDFSAKKSRLNITHQSYLTRFTAGKPFVTHDISLTTDTFSSLEQCCHF